MHDITLVCTRHEESGKCNSIELHRIIESISPDVIFEELTFANFEMAYTDGSLITLETKAIKRYLQDHSVRHTPVDTYDLSRSYYEDLYSMNDRVFNSVQIAECRSLRSLVDSQTALLSQYGFTFLNSDQNDEIFERMNNLKEAILSHMHNERLFHISEQERQAIEKREEEILRNVYDYSKENSYEQGLLLIGSGHRKSMRKRIDKWQNMEGVRLNWIIYE